MISATVVVNLQTSVSWEVGFLVPTIAFACAILIFLLGSKLYRCGCGLLAGWLGMQGACCCCRAGLGWAGVAGVDAKSSAPLPALWPVAPSSRLPSQSSLVLPRPCRRMPPGGSPFTRMARVVAGAFAHLRSVPRCAAVMSSAAQLSGACVNFPASTFLFPYPISWQPLPCCRAKVPEKEAELHEVEGDASIVPGQAKIPRTPSYKWVAALQPVARSWKGAIAQGYIPCSCSLTCLPTCPRMCRWQVARKELHSDQGPRRPRPLARHTDRGGIHPL